MCLFNYFVLGNAQNGQPASIYSPPFYSSPSGYKMCARLFLNGSGQARGIHISLFFVLMRGEYDSILAFPFNFRIIFCLYDQSPDKHHIIHSLRPDINSPSFQRPTFDMNVESGFDEFLPLDRILQEGNSYIHDDTMFIRIMVDPDSIPDDLLEFAMRLNPALPMDRQCMEIQQEIERRAQLS